MGTKLIKTLKTLENVEESRIQQLKVELNRLNNQVIRIEDSIESLKKSVEDEKAVTTQDIGLSHYHASYTKHVHQKIDLLQDELKRLAKTRDTLFETMTEHYKSQKKYEKMRDKKEKEYQEILEEKERSEMDDLTMQKWMKKNSVL